MEAVSVGRAGDVGEGGGRKTVREVQASCRRHRRRIVD